MSRRSLRPQLNQIRTWVRQGRTDAWIAHQLEVTVQQIQAFKREQGLEQDTEEPGQTPEDVDLRASDDAQIAAELEEEERRRAEEEARRAEEEARRREEEERLAAEAAARKAEEDARRAEEAAARRAEAAARRAEAGEADDGGALEDDDAEEDDGGPRRRRRRGGRRRRSVTPRTFEATFDHGEEGYGLWLDPAVVDAPVYAEHWAGHRPVEVTVEEDQIVIRRAGLDASDDDDDEE